MQAVTTSGDEVVRSATTSRETDATKLSPTNRINYPSAEIFQNLFGSNVVSRCK